MTLLVPRSAPPPVPRAGVSPPAWILLAAALLVPLALSGCRGSSASPGDAGPAADAGPLLLDAGTCPNHLALCLGRECGLSGCGPSHPHDSCGECPDGLRCSKAGRCVVPACAPACTADQWCDTRPAVPACVEICAPPAGCKATERCVPSASDPTKGSCRPLLCDGAQCLPGQLCVDLAEPGAPPAPRCSCLPDRQSDDGEVELDSCAAHGLVCDFAAAVDGSALCRLPEELEACVPRPSGPGCLNPAPHGGYLDCVKLGNGALCLRSCASGSGGDSALCVDPLTACFGGGLQQHCWLNWCADPGCDPASPDCDPEAERARLFKPCSGAYSDESTCLPYRLEDGREAGLCLQGGVAAPGGPCDPRGLRGEAGWLGRACRSPIVDAASGALVAAGEVCVPVAPESESDPLTGQCRKVCGAAAGWAPELACASPEDRCVPLAQLPAGRPATGLGACLPACDLLGAEPCPPDVYGGPAACRPGPGPEPEGHCAPLPPAPAGFGEACAATESDPFGGCGDRLVCLAGAEGATCSGYCLPERCPDPAEPCPQCLARRCCATSCLEATDAGTLRRCGVEDGCGGQCGCPAGERCSGGVCEPCAPACTEESDAGTLRRCGLDDGCGGICGCGAGERCDEAAGLCVACTPSCGAPGAERCGIDDGCGGQCACPAGARCEPSTGNCVACVPDCANKVCGEDGCGGSCGSCGEGERCRSLGPDLGCAPHAGSALGLCR